MLTPFAEEKIARAEFATAKFPNWKCVVVPAVMRQVPMQLTTLFACREGKRSAWSTGRNITYFVIGKVSAIGEVPPESQNLSLPDITSSSTARSAKRIFRQQMPVAAVPDNSYQFGRATN